jgi:hypothetical protein
MNQIIKAALIQALINQKKEDEFPTEMPFNVPLWFLWENPLKPYPNPEPLFIFINEEDMKLFKAWKHDPCFDMEEGTALEKAANCFSAWVQDKARWNRHQNFVLCRKWLDYLTEQLDHGTGFQALAPFTFGDADNYKEFADLKTAGKRIDN